MQATQAIPEFGAATSRPAAMRVRNSAYEGGASTRRTSRWNAPTVSPNAGVLANLATLRDRSRAAVRNDGYAKGAIDKLVTNIIGTGIKPLSQGPTPEFRRAFQAAWLAWTDESDADGLLDWYGQEAQACRAFLEAGECFLRLRPRLPSDGLTVPLQVQVLEPELCPHDYNVPMMASGNKIRAGIEFNAIGKRVAYWFYAQRPGDWQDFDPTDLRRVPASSVIHVYEPLRPGQIRGIPHLTQALILLFELDKFNDATLLRQQLQNMFVGFLKRDASTGDATINPVTGLEVASTDDPDKPMITLEPGTFQELASDESIEFSDPPAPSQTYPDFMRQQLYGVAAATGVPYEVLTGDMMRVNDRTVRVILHEFRRRVQMYQHQVIAFQICRPVLAAWMDRASLIGRLALPAEYFMDPAPWLAVKWMTQGWPYLQPVQDIQAKRDAVRAGFSTRSAEVSETGEDAEAIDAEQAADNERADRAGLKYESDARYLLVPKNADPATLADPSAADPASTGAAQ